MTLYNHTSRLKLKQELIAALGDTSLTYWTDLELDSLIEESLLTFGALSGFWKAPIKYDTVVNKVLYNLIDDANFNKDRVSFDYTYGDIVYWFNRDLLESITTLNPTSLVTTLDELLNFIESRIDSYNQQTSLILKVATYVTTPDQSLVTLSNDVLDIVRIEFLDEEGNSTLLLRDDEESISYSKDESLDSQNVPEFFTELFSSTKDINIYPRPNVPGTLRVIYVQGVDRTIAPDLDKVINLPNNLIPYIKFGLYEDIFNKDGLSNDPNRASYCASRWNEGIQVGRFYTSAIRATLNGRAILLDSLNKVDQCIESESGTPSILGLAGFNIFGTDTKPDAIYSIILDSIANAIIPINDTDFIQTRIEYIDYLINYCVHLGIFKSGFGDLELTMPIMQSFIKYSVEQNSRYKMKGYTYLELLGKSKQEEHEKSRIVRETNS